jgi:hypothetical protein
MGDWLIDNYFYVPQSAKKGGNHPAVSYCRRNLSSLTAISSSKAIHQTLFSCHSPANTLLALLSKELTTTAHRRMASTVVSINVFTLFIG